jgi:hypothetical protein
VEVEARRKRLGRIVTAAIIFTGSVVVAPVVFLAVKGIVGLAIAGTLGIAINAAAPVLSMKLANWRLRALKHEAKTNPIETLQNIALKKQGDLHLDEMKDTVGFHAKWQAVPSEAEAQDARWTWYDLGGAPAPAAVAPAKKKHRG